MTVKESWKKRSPRLLAAFLASAGAGTGGAGLFRILDSGPALPSVMLLILGVGLIVISTYVFSFSDVDD